MRSTYLVVVLIFGGKASEGQGPAGQRSEGQGVRANHCSRELLDDAQGHLEHLSRFGFVLGGRLSVCLIFSYLVVSVSRLLFKYVAESNHYSGHLPLSFLADPRFSVDPLPFWYRIHPYCSCQIVTCQCSRWKGWNHCSFVSQSRSFGAFCHRSSSPYPESHTPTVAPYYNQAELSRAEISACYSWVPL